MKPFTTGLIAFSLLPAPAMAGGTCTGTTTARYGNPSPANLLNTVGQPPAATVRPRSSPARWFKFSSRLPAKEDSRRSSRH
jgi:hypothetical protein